MKAQKQIFFYIILLICLITLDQITKYSLIEYLPKVGYKIEVTDFLDFRYAWNHGISFGLFSNHREYSNIFFGLFNSCTVLYILFLAQKSVSNLERCGYLIIASGAIGNLIDRIHYGAVFDFILLHYGVWQFAIFNLADFFVSLGVLLLIINIMC